eukprot:SAG25_NODE_10296_length_339_cov_0.858333_1_plen_64_part_00
MIRAKRLHGPPFTSHRASIRQPFGAGRAPDGPVLEGVDLAGRDMLATGVDTREACHGLCAVRY